MRSKMISLSLFFLCAKLVKNGFTTKAFLKKV